MIELSEELCLIGSTPSSDTIQIGMRVKCVKKINDSGAVLNRTGVVTDVSTRKANCNWEGYGGWWVDYNALEVVSLD